MFLKYTVHAQTSWRPDINYSKLEAIVIIFVIFVLFLFKTWPIQALSFFLKRPQESGPFDILLRPFIGCENAKRDYVSEDDVNVVLHRFYLYQ